MPLPSKKRSKLTLEKLKVLKKSSSKSTNCNELPSSPPHNLRISTNIPVSTYYKIIKCNKGIDIKTFRRECIINHTAPDNATNIVSRAINSTSITYSSALKNKIDRGPNYPESCLFTTKRRCVVEDFMLLPSKSRIFVLLPVPLDETKPKSYFKAIIKDEKCYITFGSSRNQRYYLCSGYIKSNPNYDLLQNDSMFTRDVMKSFKLPHNNGNGNTCKLYQVMSYENNDNQLVFSPDILIKWVEVLDGGSSGIQVWADIDGLRDYLKISFTTNYANEFESEGNKVLHFLYHELYGDKLVMMNLLGKYYMVLSKKRKAQIDILKSKEKKINNS